MHVSHRWEGHQEVSRSCMDTIQVDLVDIGWSGVDWISLIALSGHRKCWCYISLPSVSSAHIQNCPAVGSCTHRSAEKASVNKP
jgi:hypothetical protein